MSLLTGYLNQQAQLEEYVRDNDYGEPEFGSPATIACRRQTKHELFVTTRGDTKVSAAVYYTDAKVQAGDRIDGAIIESVLEMVDFGGTVQGYKVMV